MTDWAPGSRQKPQDILARDLTVEVRLHSVTRRWLGPRYSANADFGFYSGQRPLGAA